MGAMTRRRIAPGLISCCHCNRDLDAQTAFRQIHDKRRRDPDQKFPTSRCRECEKVYLAKYVMGWEARDLAHVKEIRRRGARKWRERVQQPKRREERRWASDLMRSDVAALRERGWTYTAIAAAIGSDRTSVRDWAEGRRRAQAATVLRHHAKLMALREAPVGGN